MKTPRILLALLLLAVATAGQIHAAEPVPGCAAEHVANTNVAACHGHDSVPALPGWSELYERAGDAPAHPGQSDSAALADTILLPLRMAMEHVHATLGFLAALCTKAILGR